MHLQQSASSVLGYRSSSTCGSACADSASTNLASARKVVLECVCSALGQPGQAATVQTIAAAVATDLPAGEDPLRAQLTQAVDRALDRATQQLTSRGVRADHVLHLVDKLRQELLRAFSDAATAAAAASSTLQTVQLAPI
jgi:hypothetical protein